jgi:hypothetical protein
MMKTLPTWLCPWLRENRKLARRPRQARRYRPTLEVLEERAVPALFYVNTTTDEFDGGTPANPAGPDHLLSLREAIALADADGGANTIVLPAGHFSLSRTSQSANPTAGPLQVTDALTIVGAGAGQTIIDGAQIGSVFVLGSSAQANFSFQGLTITGGLTTGNGAGIDLVTAGDSLTLTNVVVTGNTSGNNGGGIFVLGGNITLIGTTLSNNSAALNGGGLFNNGTGNLGDVRGGGTVQVTNSIVTSNFAGNEGGGLFDLGADPLSLTNSTLSGNQATGAGGGAYLEAQAVTLTGANISGNSAYQGGGLDIASSAHAPASLSLSSTSISDNHAIGDGGGIFTVTGGITLIASTVSGNTSGADGGGIEDFGAGPDGPGGESTATVSITASAISGNTAYGEGGGLIDFATGLFNLTNSQVIGNAAHFSNAGGLYTNALNVTISGSTISGNAAFSQGGGLADFGAGGQFTLSNSVVTGNTAVNVGGGIYTSDNTVWISGSTISGNSAGDAGGGICDFSSTTGTFTLTSSAVSNNLVSFVTQSSSGGGGIYTSAGTVQLTRSVLSGNRALDVNGGALFDNTAAVITLANTTLTNNTASGDGGGLDVLGGKVILTNVNPDHTTGPGSVVSGNVAGGQGGGFGGASNGVNLTGSQVLNNRAELSGGGFYDGDIGFVILNYSLVSGNVSGRDGGGFFGSTGIDDIVNSTISNNRALGAGGGFEADNGTATLASGSIVRGNRAGSNGGGIDSANSITLTASQVLNNVAAGNGGGFTNMLGGPVLIVASTIRGNRASGDGGGFTAGGGTLKIQNSTISNNQAFGNGGGFVADGGVLENGGANQIAGSTISGNAAGKFGGGVYIPGQSGAATGTTCIDDTIANNRARLQGGGLSIGQFAASGSFNTVNLTALTLAVNSGDQGGGIFAQSGANGVVTLQSTLVAQNRATDVLTPNGPDLFGSFTSQGHNLFGIVDSNAVFTNLAVSDLHGTPLAPLNPLLGPLQLNGGLTTTLALLPGSAALNKGAAGATTTDQRDQPRDSRTPDIGAFEALN